MSSAALIADRQPFARRPVPSAWITRQPRITGEQLPLTVDLSPSLLGALILCAAGVFVLGSSWEFLDDILQADEPIFFITASIFPLFGAGLVAAGLIQLYRRQVVSFGEQGVEVSERNLTGSRRWSAAYSDYAGVLQREHTVRRKNGSTTYQIIQLLHADPARDLPLHVARGDAVARDRWEALAERLRLPALHLDDDRIEARPAEALDASLDEGASGGAYGPPPAGIKVSEDSSAMLVELKGARLSAMGYALFAVFPLVFIPMGFVSPDHWPVAVIGFVLLAAIAWVRWKDLTSPRAIRLTRDTVENLDTWRWNSADALTLTLADVESVRMYRSGKAGSLVVVLEGDRGSMHLGQGYSGADLAWLRDFLIAQIALRVRRAK